MSVKNKVKRLNKEILSLKDEIETINLSNKRLREKLDEEKQYKQYTEQLENIVKFAITNHIGGIRGGMAIDWLGIDKMQDLRLDIEKNIIEHAYIMRVNYR